MAAPRRVRVLLLLVAALTVVGSPAAAADDVLLVSRDGVTFTRTMSEPVFPSPFRIVPGDVLTQDFWVRNTGGTAGRLRVELVGAHTDDPDLGRALSLGVVTQDGRGSGDDVLIADAGACTVITWDVELAAGETLRLTARAALVDLDRQLGQGAVSTFDFRLVAVDPEAPPPADPRICADDGVDIDGPDELPWTGPGQVQPLGILAAGLIGVGLLLALVRRRHDDA